MIHATDDRRAGRTRLRVGKVGGGRDRQGIAFIKTAVASNKNNGAWISTRGV
jgi:hypothetical protein